MIGFDIGGPEAIIVLVIVLVLFGGSQIPKLARNLGRAQKEFKDGIDEGSHGVGVTVRPRHRHRPRRRRHPPLHARVQRRADADRLVDRRRRRPARRR